MNFGKLMVKSVILNKRCCFPKNRNDVSKDDEIFKLEDPDDYPEKAGSINEITPYENKLTQNNLDNTGPQNFDSNLGMNKIKENSKGKIEDKNFQLLKNLKEDKPVENSFDNSVLSNIKKNVDESATEFTTNRNITDEDIKNATTLLLQDEEGELLRNSSLRINAAGLLNGIRKSKDGIVFFGPPNQNVCQI